MRCSLGLLNALLTRLFVFGCSRDPLPRYTGKTVVINLPDGYTIYDFDRFGIYCELADVDFGSIKIPHNVKVPPSQRAFGIHIEVRF